MRLVIQRVNSAAVTVESGERREIGEGLVVLFASGACDEKEDAARLAKKLAEKTAKLRIFSDEDEKMNLCAEQLGLSVLVVSQFTLYADTKKGNRPSFIGAGEPEFAKKMYQTYIDALAEYPFKELRHGEFGDYMKVELENNGPVTIIIDTEEWKNEH